MSLWRMWTRACLAWPGVARNSHGPRGTGRRGASEFGSFRGLADAFRGSRKFTYTHEKHRPNPRIGSVLTYWGLRSQASYFYPG